MIEDCRPIVGDQYKGLVTWKGGEDIGVPERAPISWLGRRPPPRPAGLRGPS